MSAGGNWRGQKVKVCEIKPYLRNTNRLFWMFSCCGYSVFMNVDAGWLFTGGRHGWQFGVSVPEIHEALHFGCERFVK